MRSSSSSGKKSGWPLPPVSGLYSYLATTRFQKLPFSWPHFPGGLWLHQASQRRGDPILEPKPHDHTLVLCGLFLASGLGGPRGSWITQPASPKCHFGRSGQVLLIHFQASKNKCAPSSTAALLPSSTPPVRSSAPASPPPQPPPVRHP